MLRRKPFEPQGRRRCMKTSRPKTKSPLALVRMALSVARESIPAYSSKFSPRRYTQHQLFALLTLREFLKVGYRGLEQILTEWAELREVLGLGFVGKLVFSRKEQPIRMVCTDLHT